MPATPQLSVKQQRDARRAEKVAALKKREAGVKRNRLIGGIIGGVLGAGVLTLIVALIITSVVPKPAPADIEIEGLATFGDVAGAHVDGTPVDYEALYDMNPPAGGDHFSAWLNCGVYTEVQQNENAVHALEHGAIWVTYDPAQIDDDALSTLVGQLPSTYSLVSPFPGLPAPVVMSAWGSQLELDGVNDERISAFLDKFWRAQTVPEPTGACSGAIDGPGKVA